VDQLARLSGFQLLIQEHILQDIKDAGIKIAGL
jgi:hypothetical protein